MKPLREFLLHNNCGSHQMYRSNLLGNVFHAFYCFTGHLRLFFVKIYEMGRLNDIFYFGKSYSEMRTKVNIQNNCCVVNFLTLFLCWYLENSLDIFNHLPSKAIHSIWCLPNGTISKIHQKIVHFYTKYIKKVYHKFDGMEIILVRIENEFSFPEANQKSRHVANQSTEFLIDIHKIFAPDDWLPFFHIAFEFILVSESQSTRWRQAC